MGSLKDWESILTSIELRGCEFMSTEMAEACGFCYRSFLPSRKINESLKCGCQRPFFSQTVAVNNLPTDLDCWIEVPKRSVRHYSSSFGEKVNFEADEGRSYGCSLVGSDIAIVGYGFEWYDFARSQNVGMGDQIVFTLIEKSRFLVQVYRANPQTLPFAKVKVEQDVDVQVAGAEDWLLAKSKRNGTNIYVKVEQDVDDLPADVNTIPLEATRASEINDEIDCKIPSCETTDGLSVLTKAQHEDAKSDNVGSEDVEASSSSTSGSDWLQGRTARQYFGTRKVNGQNQSMKVTDDENSGATTSNDSTTEEEELRKFSRRKRGVFPSRNKPQSKSKRDKVIDRSVAEEMPGGDDGKTTACSPHLYVQKNREYLHHWAKPGTTRRKTYVSKRGPVTCADKEMAFEAAKACPITTNSYLKQLEKDNVYRALVLGVPAQWSRENMPQTKYPYSGTLVDEEGKSWQARIRGTVIFWGNFALDHYLEEDDVVVMELVDSRLKSLKFLVHIFRVVDVKMTLTGKAGWEVHYSIVEGLKRVRKASRAVHYKSKGRLKTKRGRGSSSKISTRSDSAVEASCKRITRRGRRNIVLQSSEEISDDANHRTVYSEHVGEDSLRSQYARDANNGGLNRSETDSFFSELGSSAGAGSSTMRKAECKTGKQCVVCWDALAEAICVPCGHLASCSDCLMAIKSEDWGCPVCRASIQQVVKVYTV